MRPVAVSVDVPNPPKQVYEFLDVLGNHEQFLDHFLVDWQLSGPERGVGAKANVGSKAPGSDRTDFEVIEADAGRRIVEESRGGPRGRRHLRGTYLLEELPGGGTLITFTLEVLTLPTRERLLSPLIRTYLRRINRTAMARLAQRLAARAA